MARIVLRGMNGMFKGTTWEASDLLRVGRLEALEVVLDDSSVSRYHAEAKHGEGGWWLRDLGSTNGTFLNGERLGGERMRIDHGDKVRFGEVEVIVRGFVIGSAEEWDACTHPLSMLESLPHVPWTAPPYHRKLRLWAVDCIRRHGGDQLYSSRDFIRRALNRVEALIDLDPERFERGRLGLLEELVDYKVGTSRLPSILCGSVESVLCPLDESLPSSMCAAALASWGCDEGRNALNAGVLRCVLGNPWRQPAIAPIWLLVNEGAVTALAQTIERNSAFDDMPILADALEDAGCSEERLLGHLRGGVHCRSCHALDAVLGRPTLPAWTPRW